MGKEPDVDDAACIPPLLSLSLISLSSVVLGIEMDILSVIEVWGLHLEKLNVAELIVECTCLPLFDSSQCS